MIKKLENEFINLFISKDYKERLLYELNSPKKRTVGLDRFCHDFKKMISKQVSVKYNKILTEKELSLFFNQAKEVFILSSNFMNGDMVLLNEAFDCLQNEYYFLILYANNRAVVKAEYEGGKSEVYMLTI